jgi:hypothetical protein
VNIPVEVIEACSENRCVLFVGSRATLESVVDEGGTYLEQKRLARKLGGRVSVRSALADLLTSAPRDEVIKRLASHLEVADAEPGDFHRRAVKRFGAIYTTCRDDLLERAARAQGIEPTVYYPGDALPTPGIEGLHIVKLWGGFEKPESLVLTNADQAKNPMAAQKKAVRALLRKQVIFFVGYRLEEEDFDLVFEDLSEAYGGELPRVHLAVAQGKISDYHWQKWVWRGLLLFIADPSEALEAVDQQAPRA